MAAFEGLPKDFFAFFRTGRCPVMSANSSTTESSSFGCLIASPSPTLITIFVSPGTWCTLVSPNCCMSFGATVVL